MKKGLSILLIAAALFGFYGGAVNLNDVLACKDYWEKAGEESTANMNKLEDGLNQLKENEQAYLDGVQQVADGEKALADGEAALAEGRATLAQGEADYEAAPGKLADGKAQLDANKDSYVAGKAFKGVVDKAANGLSSKKAFKIIKNLLSSAGVSGVPASYKDLENTLDSLNQLKAGTDNITGMDSEKAFKVAVGSQDEATQKKLAAAGVTSYKALKAAIQQAKEGIDSLNLVKSNVDTFTGKPKEVVREILIASNDELKKAGIKNYKTLTEKLSDLNNGKKTIDKVAGATANMDQDQKKEFFVDQSVELKDAGITDYETLKENESNLSAGKKQIDDVAKMSTAEREEFFVGQSPELKAAGITSYAALEANEEALRTGKAKIDEIVEKDEAGRRNAFVEESEALKAAGIGSYAELEGTIEALEGGQKEIDDTADALFAQSEEYRKDFFVGKIEALQAAGIDSYEKLEAALEADPENEQLKTAKGQVDGLAASKDAFKNYAVSSNPKLKAKGITSYGDLENTIGSLKDGKDQVVYLAGLSDDDLRATLIADNAKLAAAGIKDYNTLAEKSKALTEGKKKVDYLSGLGEDALKDTLVAQNEALQAADIKDYETLAEKSKALTEGKAKVDYLSGLSGDALKDALVAGNDQLKKAGIKDYEALGDKISDLSEGKKKIDTYSEMLDNATSDTAMAFVWNQLDANQKAALKGQGVDGTSYKALVNAITGVKSTKASLDELKNGTDGITNMKSEAAFKTAVGTQSKAVQKQLKDSGVTSYKALTSAIGSLKQLDGFDNLLTSQKGKSKGAAYKNIVNALKNAGFGKMVGALPATYQELAGKLGEYEDGVRTYRQGLADYAAAPAKLEEGRKQLAEGEKTLAEGKATLADGKEKLAQYEDGEQQVRDGLATLMGTKPDGGLESILDRRNGDDDFDNGDTHLELDEGLEAVTTGREYQAASGVLITKEITNRAIGTAAGLGAGALAVLAAILSFLKKNKGAGVCALLSAAAGGAGVAVGTSAGMEFSSIAGSLVGATPWIAFGVLGGVALVHAIAHFASKNA